jgi:ureidoglycolate hydrolase
MKIPHAITVSDLNQKLFEPFGRILHPKPDEKALVSEKGVFDFYVPFAERSGGWQIGFLEYTGKILHQLECHPNTPEVFSPLKGEALLVLATDAEKESEYRGFRLEKPIVLGRGIWHGVICLSEKAEMLIVENPDVVDEFHELARPIKGE